MSPGPVIACIFIGMLVINCAIDRRHDLLRFTRQVLAALGWRDLNRLADPTPTEAETIREQFDDWMALIEATREDRCLPPPGRICTCHRCVAATVERAEQEANQ